MDSDTLELLKRIERGLLINVEDNDTALVLKNLEEGRFIMQEDFNELAYLKVMTSARRFGSRSLGLTIAPTLECNFACTYCYENHVNVTMNAETISALKHFLEKETTTIEQLGIAWFGGEPLLCMGILRDISHSILRLQKEHGFHFESGIVTNGYLLTKKKAEELHKLNVTKIQVTIDGPEEVHDRRRPLKNGKGTFYKILNNLVETSDILKDTSIRVNIDISNVKRVPELFDILDTYGLKEKVGIYFSPVQVFSNMCKDISANCLGYETFSRHEIHLYRKAVESGIRVWRYPAPLFGYCGAVNLHSFVVDPYGNFHKCWNTVGMENEAVGKIGESPNMNAVLLKWLSWDPFEDRECRDCKFLPICMGGCPYLLRTQERNCDPWKYNLGEMLNLYYISKKAHTKFLQQ